MKIKKIFIAIVIFFSIYFSTFSVVIADDEEIEELNNNDIEEILQISAEAEKNPTINSRAAVVIDRNTHRVLYGKDENEKRKMASTTKIMTAIVVLENSNLKDLVEVSKKAAGTGGSRLGLKAGDKVTVNDLLYGLMLRSGNDAAVALAEHVGGSIEEFAILMNKKADNMNLKNTHFVTPHGLDEEEHYTTAYELAILADYGLGIDKFKEIVGTSNYTVTINGYTKSLHNTNELLGNLNGVYGVKTGFTNGANRCLVTSIKRGDMDVICVVLGADTKKLRTQDSIKLIEYVFNSYENINLENIIQSEFINWSKKYEANIEILKGKQDKLQVKLGEINISKIPILKENEKDIQIEIEVNNILEAPIENGQIVGKCKVMMKEEIIEEVDIKASEKIERKSVFNYFEQLTKKHCIYIMEIFSKNFINNSGIS